MRRTLGKAALQAYGAQLQPYFRIGGNIPYTPPILAKLQTDGSRTSSRSRVAMILTTRDHMNIHKKVLDIPHTESSTEAEWASIAAGLEFTIQKGETCIGIENDNLGVVGALITDKRDFRNTYAYYYRDKILRMTRLTLWTGIRWIPREINRADDLFYAAKSSPDPFC
jgi:ribonuclease HI